MKPMLAGVADLMKLSYPIALTPKFDGIRVLVKDGVAISRTLKPIRNKKLQEILSVLKAIGPLAVLDGEIIANTNNFQDSTTAVMRADAEIPWTYHIFDYIENEDNPDVPYVSRMAKLRELMELHSFPAECKIVAPIYAYELDAVQEIAREHIAQGHEGSILRDPKGRYKYGRSTSNEGLLLKLKQFSDTEAVIIGFEELLHNNNEATTNSLGRTERSQHKENKTQSGILGAFVVHPIEDPTLIYKVGTGMTHKQREHFWQEREQLVGKLIKVKYFDHGIKQSTGCPRHPVWLGFRDPDDLE